jgi:hypothetical protein
MQVMRENRSGRGGSSGGPSKLTVAIAVAALCAISAGCGGCLWIAIPSLAYQGYKYESGDQSGQAKQHQSSQQTPANDDVE